MKKMKNSNSKFLLIIMILFLAACSSGGSDDDGPIVINPPIDNPIDDPINGDLAGGYKGTWTSVTPTTSFNGFPISARFTSNADETRLTGEFFAASGFKVCCSTGDNDGTMAMDINGTTISNFTFNDVITNCSGNFIGSGIISGIEFIIDFTGTDCDGEHVGQMIFEKIEN
jgi:hypothetical protein